MEKIAGQYARYKLLVRLTDRQRSETSHTRLTLERKCIHATFSFLLLLTSSSNSDSAGVILTRGWAGWLYRRATIG